MTDIRFTVYGERKSPLINPEFLLDQFEKQQKTRVLAEHMAWEEAWPKLLDFALRGGGPHISIIGAIWTSSLMAMNSLRPITTQDIISLGGSDAFFPSTWESTLLTSTGQTWGIPFNAYTYLVFYRRDLLAKAGVEEQTAFISPEVMLETLAKLKGSGVESPIVLPSGKPLGARLHLAASWIWGAGGDFIGEDRKQVLFAQKEALDGLAAFFSLYRYLAPADYGLTQEECYEHFANGKSAVIVAGNTFQRNLRQIRVPQVLENLGVVQVPGIPWVAGANIVIWKEAQLNPLSERGAVALAKFLTSTEAQVKYAQDQATIPSRAEAFEATHFDLPVLKAAARQSLVAGHSYRPISLWIRVMNELRPTLDNITQEFLENTEAFPNSIALRMLCAKHLEPLARRIGILLSNIIQ
jgi:multiple sugar transport system substrate-binding protein